MNNINNSWSQKKIIKYISENRKIVKISYEGLSGKYSNHKSKITFGNYCLHK